MWKDDYRSGMKKLSPGERWRAETLRRMEASRPRPVRLVRAAGLAACAAVLALAVMTAWPGESPQTAGTADQTSAAAAQREAPVPQTVSAPRETQDVWVEADTAPVRGTVLRRTDRELVLELEDGEQVFLLDADSEVAQDALTEGAVVQVYWESGADGTRHALRVEKASG